MNAELAVNLCHLRQVPPPLGPEHLCLQNGMMMNSHPGLGRQEALGESLETVTREDFVNSKFLPGAKHLYQHDLAIQSPLLFR